MQPEIGPIKTFGVMFALAFVACGAMAWRRFQELGKPTDWAYEVVFSALIGGLIGAKLYFVIEHPGELSFSGFFSGSGLVFYGGAVGGAAASARSAIVTACPRTSPPGGPPADGGVFAFPDHRPPEGGLSCVSDRPSR